jgi:hypothetical protein
VMCREKCSVILTADHSREKVKRDICDIIDLGF